MAGPQPLRRTEFSVSRTGDIQPQSAPPLRKASVSGERLSEVRWGHLRERQNACENGPCVREDPGPEPRRGAL